MDVVRLPGSPAAARVETVLVSLRRAQRRMAGDPRRAIDQAVKQLLALPRGAARPAELDATYRIDDLARVADVTVRNIRAYRERGLLHPPRRTGRVALFDDTHVARLKVITSMLERGYTAAHILELLTAWERGQKLSDVLGLETLIEPRVDDLPVTLSPAEADELAGSSEDAALLRDAGLMKPAGRRVRVLRPKLIEAIAELRGYGLTTTQMLDVHAEIVPPAHEISRVLVEAGAEVLGRRMFRGAQDGAAVAELVANLARFRELAMATVTSTIAAEIERTVEEVLGVYLEAWMAAQRPAEPG